MTIDSENIYNAIRLGVDLEKYSPDKLTEMWRQVFGGNEKNNIRREKFTNIGGNLTTSDDSILEGARLNNLENYSLLSWSGEGRPMHLKISDEFFIGIQNHESGEKSVVLVCPSTDKTRESFKQTTRRFTPVKE